MKRGIIIGLLIVVSSVVLVMALDAPIINNIDSYWFQGEGRYNKYIYFEIDLDEDNLDEVSILDNNARRPRWKRICSRLKNGMCVKKVSFKMGHHEVDVMVMDEAGNAIGERIVFDVV
tara:strand:+ start:1561 stop:1914 length:354 start_codon:yes stop_codon:yes gene_type:complete